MRGHFVQCVYGKLLSGVNPEGPMLAFALIISKQLNSIIHSFMILKFYISPSSVSCVICFLFDIINVTVLSLMLDQVGIGPNG